MLPVLFAEEPGLVLEVQEPYLAQVLKCYRDAGLHCLEMGCTGHTGPHAMVRKRGKVAYGGEIFICQPNRDPGWVFLLLASDGFVPL